MKVYWQQDIGTIGIFAECICIFEWTLQLVIPLPLKRTRRSCYFNVRVYFVKYYILFVYFINVFVEYTWERIECDTIEPNLNNLILRPACCDLFLLLLHPLPLHHDRLVLCIARCHVVEDTSFKGSEYLP